MQAQNTNKVNPSATGPLLLEACRGAAGECKNALVAPGELGRRLAETLSDLKLAERLLQKLGPGPAHHKKLKLALAACPNACSRPQIADLAIVVHAYPRLARPEDCTGCGACREACPDGAARLTDAGPEFDLGSCLGCGLCVRACSTECLDSRPPEYSLLAGGRLGRRPRLAVEALRVADPARAFSEMAAVLEEHLSLPGPLPRFADWWWKKYGG